MTRPVPQRPGLWSIHAVLLLLCGVWALPVVALLISSFRDPFAISTSGWWTVFQDGGLTLRNFKVTLLDRGLDRALVNSAIITVPAVVMMTSIGAVTSYTLTRFNFRGRAIYVGVVMVLLVIPVQMILVPVLRLYNAVDLTGTYAGIWLVHTGFALPFATYLMRNFFATLPRHLFEAAVIDGASETQIFTRIALPIATPGIASVAIFQFVWVWNDLLISLIFLGGSADVAPVTLAIANLVNATTGEGWELLTAAAFIAMAPPLIVFFALQRYFVRGLIAGSAK